MKFKVPKGATKVAFTIRVAEEDFNVIDSIHKQTDKSYNYIVNAMIKYSIENMDAEDLKLFAGEEE